MIAQMLSRVKKERKAQIEKTTREVFLSLKPYRFRLGKAYFFAKIFVPYLTTAYGQPEKSLISCGFARLDLFTSTCFCLSWCVTAIIITFVLCYELISMITEKNNLHDMDTWMFFKWFFKAAVAIYLVTHTFDIVMAVFDIGQNVVSGAAGVIHGNTSIDIDSTIAQMRTGMENMGVGELLGLSIETLLISLCLKIMAILITVILYGRMIEIYCTVSIAPIPIATMSNREWGSIGTNYLKGLFALAFQGFLIMVCVGIYAVLINGMIIADNIHSALFSVAAYTVILCFSLFKTGSLAKSIFHAH